MRVSADVVTHLRRWFSVSTPDGRSVRFVLESAIGDHAVLRSLEREAVQMASQLPPGPAGLAPAP
jgi:hypothetical protein